MNVAENTKPWDEPRTSPPEDIQLDKDGHGFYFERPDEEDKNEQYMWAVSNNNADNKFKRSVRVGYFTQEQIDHLRKIQKNMRRHDQMFNNCLLDVYKILFPQHFSDVDKADYQAVVDAIYDFDKINYIRHDISKWLHDFAYALLDGKAKESDVDYYILDRLQHKEEDAVHVLKRLNELSSFEMIWIRHKLVTAAITYGYMRLNNRE